MSDRERQDWAEAVDPGWWGQPRYPELNRESLAILSAYLGRRNQETVYLEIVEEVYPELSPERIARQGAILERCGLIEAVEGGGHRITKAGERLFLFSEQQ